MSRTNAAGGIEVHENFAGSGRTVTIDDGTQYQIVWDIGHPWISLNVTGMPSKRYVTLIEYVSGPRVSVTATVNGLQRTMDMVTVSRCDDPKRDARGILRCSFHVNMTRRTSVGQKDGEQPFTMPKGMIEEVGRLLGLTDEFSRRLLEEAQLQRVIS